MSLARLALGAALLASSVQASIFIQAPKNYRSVSITLALILLPVY